MKGEPPHEPRETREQGVCMTQPKAAGQEGARGQGGKAGGGRLNDGPTTTG
jgi:hypothetical protein